MTQEQKELQRQYEEMLATMATPGWALILEDFERLRASYGDVRLTTNLDLNKGRLDILDLLFKWQDAVNLSHSQLLAELEVEQPRFQDKPGVAEVVDAPRI